MWPKKVLPRPHCGCQMVLQNTYGIPLGSQSNEVATELVGLVSLGI